MPIRERPHSAPRTRPPKTPLVRTLSDLPHGAGTSAEAPVPLDGDLAATRDAVIAKDGLSYSRDALAEWAAHSRTSGYSPTTGELIIPSDAERAEAFLVAARALRDQIVRDPERRGVTGSRLEVRARDLKALPSRRELLMRDVRLDIWTRNRAGPDGRVSRPPVDPEEGVSEDLIDNLTLGRMRRPVVAADHQLYDEDSLARAYRHKAASPNTNLPMQDGSVIVHRAAERLLAKQTASAGEGSVPLGEGSAPRPLLISAPALRELPRTEALARTNLEIEALDRSIGRNTLALDELRGPYDARTLTLMTGLAVGAAVLGGLSVFGWNAIRQGAAHAQSSSRIDGAQFGRVFGTVLLTAAGLAGAGIALVMLIAVPRRRGQSRTALAATLQHQQTTRARLQDATAHADDPPSPTLVVEPPATHSARTETAPREPSANRDETRAAERVEVVVE